MKITIPSKKAFMLSMIRDHLLIYKLLQGFEKIGLDASNFDLFTGDNIFILLGFRNSAEEEKLFENFLGWSEEVFKIDLSGTDGEQLNQLCRKIYRKLKKEQKLRKQEKSN